MKTEITDSDLVNISDFLLEIKDEYKDNPKYTSVVITLAQAMNARFAEQQFIKSERVSIMDDILDEQ